MQRGRTAWLALVSVAFTVAGGPALLVGLGPWLITRWEVEERAFGFVALRVMGAVLVAAGLPVLLESIVRFVRVGRGTLVPTVPTETLVVSGLYRFVRNPMYLAVITMILGEAALFGSAGVLLYAAVVALGFHVFVTGYEEPTLRRTYGAQYESYCRAVRRWVPRWRASNLW